MFRTRPILVALVFATVLLTLVFASASGAPGDTPPRVIWTERHPVSPPCEPNGPGWYRTYGQDTRGDARLYKGASVTLPDSAAAFQAALRRAQGDLANIIRGKLQQVLYSYLERWPRTLDRESNRAFADATIAQVDRAVSGTASVWKRTDCPQSDADGNVRHQAFVVVGTDLSNMIRAIWSTAVARLAMPEATGGESDSDVFERTVLDALGVRAPGGLSAEVAAAELERREQKRLKDDRRAADELRAKTERLAETERRAERDRLAEDERSAEKQRRIRQQQVADSVKAAAVQRQASEPKVATPEWRSGALRIMCMGAVGFAGLSKFKHIFPELTGDYTVMHLPTGEREAGVQVSMGLVRGLRLATELGYAARGDGPLALRSRDYRATLQWTGESTTADEGTYLYLLGGADLMDIVSATLDPTPYGSPGPRMSLMDSVNRRGLGWHVGIGGAGRRDDGWLVFGEFQYTRMLTRLVKGKDETGVISAWVWRMGFGR